MSAHAQGDGPRGRTSARARAELGGGPAGHDPVPAAAGSEPTQPGGQTPAPAAGEGPAVDERELQRSIRHAATSAAVDAMAGSKRVFGKTTWLLIAVIAAAFYFGWVPSGPAPVERPAGPGAPPGGDPDHGAEIARLEARAESLLGERDLTEPVFETAHAAYREILRLDPTHAGARAGLRRIADGYLELAEAALGQGRVSDGRRLLERGLLADPGHSALLDARSALPQEQ